MRPGRPRQLGPPCAADAGHRDARTRPLGAASGGQGGATRKSRARALSCSERSVGVARRGDRACMARVTCTDSRDEDQNQTNESRQKREERARGARSLGLGNARLRVCISSVGTSIARRPAEGSTDDIASDTFSGRRCGGGRRQREAVVQRAIGVCLFMASCALVRELPLLRYEAGQPGVLRYGAL